VPPTQQILQNAKNPHQLNAKLSRTLHRHRQRCKKTIKQDPRQTQTKSTPLNANGRTTTKTQIPRSNLGVFDE